jgi:hypothetical protein
VRSSLAIFTFKLSDLIAGLTRFVFVTSNRQLRHLFGTSRRCRIAALDVRFGSGTDIAVHSINVRVAS